MGSHWWHQKRVIVFRLIQAKKVKFPILFYMDATQAIEKKDVPVRTETGEGLDRWMDLKKSDFSITEVVSERYNMQ